MDPGAPALPAVAGLRVVEVPDRDGTGSTTSVNGPISFRGRPLRTTGVVPRLGEHADARFGSGASG